VVSTPTVSLTRRAFPQLGSPTQPPLDERPRLAAATGADRDLAVHMLRRPVLAQCLEDDGSQLPCHEVALGPGGLHHAKCISDPWGGHLVEAPLLFVSSIPGGRG
jgi:hypothetical protein